MAKEQDNTKYPMELTANEIRSIGERRWSRQNSRWLFYSLALFIATLVTGAIGQGIVWVEHGLSTALLVVGILILLAWVWRGYKAGHKLLVEVTGRRLI